MAEIKVIAAKPKGLVRRVDVTTEVTQLLVDNPFRVNWSAKNIGTEHVFYGFDRKVAATGTFQGWRIDAGGGSVSDEWWTGPIWAVSAAGTQTVIVQEVAGEYVREFRKLKKE